MSLPVIVQAKYWAEDLSIQLHLKSCWEGDVAENKTNNKNGQGARVASNTCLNFNVSHSYKHNSKPMAAVKSSTVSD